MWANARCLLPFLDMLHEVLFCIPISSLASLQGEQREKKYVLYIQCILNQQGEKERE